jgi:hypothetical protein
MLGKARVAPFIPLPPMRASSESRPLVSDPWGRVPRRGPATPAPGQPAGRVLGLRILSLPPGISSEIAPLDPFEAKRRARPITESQHLPPKAR